MNQTWQKYPDNEAKYSASWAVDGNRSNLALMGEECTVSAPGKSKAEWRIDLGNVLSIHHIFIQYTTENLEWGENFSKVSCFSLQKYKDN